MATCLVQFQDGEYSIIEKDLIFLDDPDEEIDEEKKYKILWDHEKTEKSTMNTISSLKASLINTSQMRHNLSKDSSSLESEDSDDSYEQESESSECSDEDLSDDLCELARALKHKPKRAKKKSRREEIRGDKRWENKSEKLNVDAKNERPKTSNKLADESLDLENVIKKHKESDQYINELKDELKQSQDRIKEQHKELEMFKVLRGF